MLHQVEMHHDEDPKKVILDSIGDISGVKVAANLVLIASYKRPEKSKGGLIMTEKWREEENYQGKVGLILKRGPKAFDSTYKEMYGDFDPVVGAWIMYRTMEAPSFGLNGLHCRWIEDNHVRFEVPHPDMIF